MHTFLIILPSSNILVKLQAFWQGGGVGGGGGGGGGGGDLMNPSTGIARFHLQCGFWL